MEVVEVATMPLPQWSMWLRGNAVSMSFSLAERHYMRECLGAETFDVLIIGGGMNGTGIARDAGFLTFLPESAIV
jgi:hypothetical protein